MNFKVGDIVSQGPLEGARILEFLTNYSEDRCVKVQYDGDGDIGIELVCKLYMPGEDYKAPLVASALDPKTPRAAKGELDDYALALENALTDGLVVNVKDFQGQPERVVRKNIDRLRRGGLAVSSLGKGQFQV